MWFLIINKFATLFKGTTRGFLCHPVAYALLAFLWLTYWLPHWLVSSSAGVFMRNNGFFQELFALLHQCPKRLG